MSEWSPILVNGSWRICRMVDDNTMAVRPPHHRSGWASQEEAEAVAAEANARDYLARRIHIHSVGRGLADRSDVVRLDGRFWHVGGRQLTSGSEYTMDLVEVLPGEFACFDTEPPEVLR